MHTQQTKEYSDLVSRTSVSQALIFYAERDSSDILCMGHAGFKLRWLNLERETDYQISFSHQQGHGVCCQQKLDLLALTWELYMLGFHLEDQMLMAMPPRVIDTTVSPILTLFLFTISIYCQSLNFWVEGFGNRPIFSISSEMHSMQYLNACSSQSISSTPNATVALESHQWCLCTQHSHHSCVSPIHIH